MATEMRRFTVSITPDMDFELDGAKKETYYKSNQTEMIRDLIARGLQDLKVKKAEKTEKAEKAEKTEKAEKENRCDRVSQTSYSQRNWNTPLSGIM